MTLGEVVAFDPTATSLPLPMDAQKAFMLHRPLIDYGLTISFLFEIVAAAFTYIKAYTGSSPEFDERIRTASIPSAIEIPVLKKWHRST